MTADRRAYWVWLQHAFSPGSSKPRLINSRFPDISEWYNGGPGLWAQFSFINNSEISAMCNFTLKHAEAMLNFAESLGQTVLTPDDKGFPRCLWNIKDPPCVLYCKGNIPDFDNTLCISMVGSRKTDEATLNLATTIAYDLSTAGVIVISGGAVGVDAASHKGAMMASSPTVCVLGCGLDVKYLMQNEHLRQQIIEKGGLLITEYPPGTSVQRGTFQARNRIVSGLARGVLIVSAGEKSGTMITAKRATEQDKDIFAIPGSPANELSAGPNGLIRDGAVPVTAAQDILDEYSGLYGFRTDIRVVDAPYPQQTSLFDEPEPVDEETSETVLPDGISDNAKLVYSSLTKEPQHISVICEKTGLSTALVSACMTELEINGLASDFSGKRYSLFR